jgi:hypothetical protein
LLGGNHHGPFGKSKESSRTNPRWQPQAPERIGRLTAA